MKSLLVLSLFVVDCGTCEKKPTFHPNFVSDEYREVFDSISNELNEKLGYDAVGFIQLGYGYIISSEAKLKSYNDQLRSYGYRHDRWGFSNRDLFDFGITLVPVSVITSGLVKSTLAHEIGHMLGLVHVDHGIMTADVSEKSKGQEVDLLVEALYEQGVL